MSFWQAIFILCAALLFFCVEKHNKGMLAKKKAAEQYARKDDINYHFSLNNPSFKHKAFTDEEVLELSRLMGLNIPRPDPFRLRSFLGTTLDRKHVAEMTFHHLCVKMHKYTWHDKEWILFDIERHAGPPVMKGVEINYPFYHDEVSFWMEMDKVSEKWSDLIKSLSKGTKIRKAA